MIKRGESRYLDHRQPGTFRNFSTVQWCGGRLNVMQRVDIACAALSGSTASTRTSGAADSLAEGCGKGTRVVSDPCTVTSSSALTSRLGGTKSGPRRDVASGPNQ